LMQCYYPLLSCRRLPYGATYEKLVHIEMDFTRAEDAKQPDKECNSITISEPVLQLSSFPTETK
jgi:hypothetical protein